MYVELVDGRVLNCVNRNEHGVGNQALTTPRDRCDVTATGRGPVRQADATRASA
jgi:hypothetical protein